MSSDPIKEEAQISENFSSVKPQCAFFFLYIVLRRHRLIWAPIFILTQTFPPSTSNLYVNIRSTTEGKKKVASNTSSDKYLFLYVSQVDY